MNLRAAAATVILLVALSLTACSKSSEQVACEQSGGTWETYVITYTTTLVYTGKSYIPVVSPVYGMHCMGGGQ